MEKEKKSKFGAIVSGAGKTARNLFDKSREFAVRAADQNDDGKLDLADVSAIAGSMGDAVKKSAQAMQENAEAAARQRELKSLQPLFPSLLDSADFSMPKFIRVADRDKKHAESEVCQGAEYLIGTSLEALCRYAKHTGDPYEAEEAGDRF